ncbi:hypothetical protein [Citricoccus alkalitolerans]
MSIIPDEDRHVLSIGLSLPLSLMGTITKLIGAAWPESAMHNGHRSMEFLIPKTEPIEVTEEPVNEAVEASWDEFGLDAALPFLAWVVPLACGICQPDRRVGVPPRDDRRNIGVDVQRTIGTTEVGHGCHVHRVHPSATFSQFGITHLPSCPVQRNQS